jgi:hypothetical protein
MTRMAIGFSLLDHVAAMLNGVVDSAVFLGGIIPPKINLKQLPFNKVLMDSWYATQKLMAQIEQLEKLYYCPLKCNRRVDDSRETQPKERLDELVWSAEDLQQGKLIKVRGFPKNKQVKLLRVTVSTNAPRLCRNQRLISNFHHCCPRCVWHPLEN